MIECVIVVIQFLCQTMDLGTLSPHKYLFFATNHVRHPLSDHLKGSLDMFDPDLDILEIQWDLKTDIITAKIIVKYIQQVLKCMKPNVNMNVCNGRAKSEKYRPIKIHCIQ